MIEEETKTQAPPEIEVPADAQKSESASLQKIYKELDALRFKLAESIHTLDYLISPKPRDIGSKDKAEIGNANILAVDSTVGVLKWQADRIARQLQQLRFGVKKTNA